MATVVLERPVLSLASDPSQQIAAYTSDRTDSLAVPGEVRRMANGRLRVVTRAGSQQTLGVTFRNLSPSEVATVRSWAGRVVLFRDVLGRKLYCTYLTADVVDYRDRSAQDVKVVLSEVSFSEAK